MATDDARAIEDILPGLGRTRSAEEKEDMRRDSLKRRVIEGTRLDEASGCWLWNGARNEKYGRMKVDGRLELPHRVMAYATYKLKSIRQGGRRLVVMHQCDQPLCCNPGHLVVGTPSANMQDAARKGRLARQNRKPPHAPAQ